MFFEDGVLEGALVITGDGAILFGEGFNEGLPPFPAPGPPTCPE